MRRIHAGAEAVHRSARPRPNSRRDAKETSSSDVIEVCLAGRGTAGQDSGQYWAANGPTVGSFPVVLKHWSGYSRKTADRKAALRRGRGPERSTHCFLAG